MSYTLEDYLPRNEEEFCDDCNSPIAQRVKSKGLS